MEDAEVRVLTHSDGLRAAAVAPIGGSWLRSFGAPEYWRKTSMCNPVFMGDL